MTKMTRLSKAFELQFGRQPEMHELAAELGVDAARIRDAYEAVSAPRSLDAPVGDAEGGALSDIIEVRCAVRVVCVALVCRAMGVCVCTCPGAGGLGWVSPRAVAPCAAAAAAVPITRLSCPLTPPAPPHHHTRPPPPSHDRTSAA
jgi:hypothetical protein